MIEEVGCGAVIVRGPFDEVVGNVKRGRIWTSVFEIDDDDLNVTGELAGYGRNAIAN